MEEYIVSTEVVQSVEQTDKGLLLEFETGGSLSIPNWTNNAVEPGERLEFRWAGSAGWGGTVRAAYKLQDGGYELLFSYTDEYLRAMRRRDEAALVMEREREYVLCEAEWRRQLRGLGQPLSARMRRFIEETGFKEFFVQGGAYELYCCVEAQKLIDHALKNTLPSEELVELEALSLYELQQRGVHMDDGHSGNTWASAFALARYVLEGKVV